MKKSILFVFAALFAASTMAQTSDSGLRVWENNVVTYQAPVDNIDSITFVSKSAIGEALIGDLITGITPIVEDEVEVGYTMSFLHHDPINIYHGQKGEKGVDGTNGTNGEDGITPLFKIEEDLWWISYNEGESWSQLGQAKGDKGDKGDSMLQSITQDEDSVYFTLEDGTLITISKNGNGIGKDQPLENGHAYVDLGLPSGTMWATCNLGGYYSGDYGDFYHFGAITPETMLAADTAFVVNDVTIGENGSIAGSSYDAARINWGGKWKIPTKSEWEELYSNCTFHYTTALNRDGVSIEGALLKSNINGNSLFLVFDDVPRKNVSGNGWVYTRSYGHYMTSNIAHIYSTYYEAFYYLITHETGYWTGSGTQIQERIVFNSMYLKSNESTFRMIRPVFHP
jgi:hypothetical protein